jgi:thiol-disulfide isomerase/thioredoxin
MRIPARFLFLGAAFSFLFLTAIGPIQTQAAPGQPAARSNKAAAGDPEVIDLGGYKALLERYHGRPMLVTFWATWCEPCRDEYPMIVELAKQYAPQGLAVIGVSLDTDDDLSLVRQFLAEHHPGFPNYRQRIGIDADAFYQGVNPDWRGTMPQTVFYARDGHLARYFVGQRNRQAFEDAIRLILASPMAGNWPPVALHAGN